MSKLLKKKTINSKPRNFQKKKLFFISIFL